MKQNQKNNLVRVIASVFAIGGYQYINTYADVSKPPPLANAATRVQPLGDSARAAFDSSIFDSFGNALWLVLAAILVLIWIKPVKQYFA